MPGTLVGQKSLHKTPMSFDIGEVQLKVLQDDFSLQVSRLHNFLLQPKVWHILLCSLCQVFLSEWTER